MLWCKFARVDVQYEFTNRGKAKSMDVGFEATGPYDPAGESRFNKSGKHPHIFDFTVEMNGQELPIRNYVIRESSEEEAADFVPLDLNVWREPTAEEDYLGNLVNRKDPDEIFTFVENFRRTDPKTYLVVVPTSFNSVTEEEWKERGVNVVIYANQLIRAEFPAMQKVADTILKHHRAMEADDMLLPIKDIIRLIPEDY